MLFKLSLKNMKKSMKDYAIYFFTLILGVAIFYVFNSLETQSAMMRLSSSKQDIMKLLIQLLGGFSVFVAIVLGFLVIYANRFLMKRRKKEFGIYMTLGMGKATISRLLLIETFIIGLISLGVGLGVGILASQGMSILIANMFEADMTQFHFVLSLSALWKTVIYFGVMYLLVMIFNTISISKCKLLNFLNAKKQNEKIKFSHPVLSIFLFLLSSFLLGYAYYKVVADSYLMDEKDMLLYIAMGIVGTYLFFRSLTGFLFRLVKSCRKFYLKGLNTFVFRQVSSQINTAVVSMTIICLLLFLTIGVFSTAVSLKDATSRDLKHLVPADIQFQQHFENLPYGTIKEVMKDRGVPYEEYFQESVSLSEYRLGITIEDTSWEAITKLYQEGSPLRLKSEEQFLKLSEYNQLAKLYSLPTFSLKEDEYVLIANYDNMKAIRNLALKENGNLSIDGKVYHPKYDTCQDGFLMMSATAENTGIYILPDHVLEEKEPVKYHLVANYKGQSKEQKEKLEETFLNKFNREPYCVTVNYKADIYESSIGIGAIVTFVGLYLGIVFLISSAAILALKQLSESSDNKERYQVLRNLGTDEKMINRGLFQQIAIYFLLPLSLAIIHSIFGIQFVHKAIAGIGNINILSSIIMTACFMIIIYGGYFLITYLSSKRIIRENR